MKQIHFVDISAVFVVSVHQWNDAQPWFVSTPRVPTRHIPVLSQFRPTSAAAGGLDPHLHLLRLTRWDVLVRAGRAVPSQPSSAACLPPLFGLLHPPPPPPPDKAALLRTPRPPTWSSRNQQICNLPVVMNRGRLHVWLPPQAQMDDSGMLKCFLRRRGWQTQGEWEQTMFLFYFYSFHRCLADDFYSHQQHRSKQLVQTNPDKTQQDSALLIFY